MKVLNGIEIVDLAIYTNNTLIFTDFHIGYEEALNKQGLMVPRFQFEEIIKRLDNIFSKLNNIKIDRIIINGDLKHEFGSISDQEWRHTLKLLDYFGKYCNEIIIIKGNHDNILGPIVNKRNIKVLDYYVINQKKMGSVKSTQIKKNIEAIKNITSDNKTTIKTQKNIISKIISKKLMDKIINKHEKNILIIHGDKIPENKIIKNISTIIIGHEHPAVSIKDGPRLETFKAFLVGKWKKYNIIAQPSFNLVTEGTDVMKEKILSPFLKNNLRKFDVVLVGDKLYKFGKLRNL